MLLNIIKYGLSEGVAKIAPFLTTLYVAKFLSPELFGKYSLIVVMFEITFILISFNIQATTRIDYFKEDTDSFNNIKQNHFILSVFITFLGLFALFFVEESERVIVIILLFSALMRTGSVFILAMFQCARRVNAYIITNVLFVIILSGVTFTLVNMGASFYSWLYAMLFASAVQLVLAMNLYGFKNFRHFSPKTIRFDSLKIMFIPAVLFMPQAIGWWLKSGADRVIISDALGDVTLGHYALAFQFSSITLIVVGVINLALVPEMNKLLSLGKGKEVSALINKASVFVFLICISVSFFGYQFINLLYSLEYAPALPIFIMLVFSTLPQAIMLLVINVLYFKGEGLFVAKLVFYSFFAQAIISYIVAPIFGVLSMVINSLFVNVIVLLLIWIRKNKIIL